MSASCLEVGGLVVWVVLSCQNVVLSDECVLRLDFCGFGVG